ncbi:hypothetical protein TNCV_4878051 [Trichonephila clavipes]|nr:hypothetical protein TNCV_4878051 [Trichonephila clavipes]
MSVSRTMQYRSLQRLAKRHEQCDVSNYPSDLGEYYTTHQAMPSEVPVDRWEGVDGLRFVGQEYPTHVLLNSSPVSMLANPYGGYPSIEGIRLQCLHGDDGRCHP